MKAKNIFLILFFFSTTEDYAQTAINQTIPVRAGQTVQMKFDYPELIRVTTWDGNAISIQGSVNINGGENDDAFVLENTTAGNVVKIQSEIRDMKNLPRRITIDRGGQQIMFRDKAEFQKYQAEHGKSYNSVSWGPDIDIELEIKVPRDMATHIRAVYGMVEVRNFSGPLTVDATYGGVDASLAERSIGELTAETNFGNIYTNLDLKFTDEEMKSRDFHTFVSVKPGSGPKYSFESKYGNVYLRKVGQ
ncbi:MAG: hypothetical protein WEB30_13495 [Cyclobacteriaceae bacterium]